MDGIQTRDSPSSTRPQTVASAPLTGRTESEIQNKRRTVTARELTSRTGNTMHFILSPP